MKKLHSLLLLPLILLVLSVILIQRDMPGNNGILILIISVMLLSSVLFTFWLTNDRWVEIIEEIETQYDTHINILNLDIEKRQEEIDSLQSKLYEKEVRIKCLLSSEKELSNTIKVKNVDLNSLTSRLKVSSELLIKSAIILAQVEGTLESNEAKIQGADRLISSMVADLDARAKQIENQMNQIMMLENELSQHTRKE